MCINLARNILARQDWNAEDLGDELVGGVFSKFCMPLSVMRDRTSLIASYYWSHSCYHLKVPFSYITAFHPQTDGQTERQIQTVEQHPRY